MSQQRTQKEELKRKEGGKVWSLILFFGEGKNAYGACLLILFIQKERRRVAYLIFGKGKRAGSLVVYLIYSEGKRVS